MALQCLLCLCVCVPLLGCVQLNRTLWTVACQAPLFIGFSRQEYWSGLPFPSPEDLPNPGIKPKSPACISCIGRQVLSHLSHLGSPGERYCSCFWVTVSIFPIVFKICLHYSTRHHFLSIWYIPGNVLVLAIHQCTKQSLVLMEDTFQQQRIKGYREEMLGIMKK